MKDDLLTIQQAAKLLGVSTRTLRRWEERGHILPQRTIGNQRRYSRIELETKFKSEKGKAKIPQMQSFENQTTAVATAKTEGQPKEESEFNREQTQEIDPVVKNTNPMKLPVFAGALLGIVLFLGIIMLIISDSQIGHMVGKGMFALTASSRKLEKPVVQQQVLAANDRTPVFQMQVNIPGMFGKKVSFLDSVAIKKALTVTGLSQLNGGIKTNNKDINAGTGKITASNIIYSVRPGSGITISGDKQNPTISAAGGVTSFQGQSGAITLTNGSGISLNGLQITNTGVLSVQGQTGDVTFTGGSGISVSGTTINNTDAGSAQNIFKNFTIGATTITAGNNNDTFTFAAGSGITLTGDAGSKTLTIASSGGGGLSGLTTNGVLYATSATTATTTTPGTNGTVLHGVTGGAPVFSAVDLTADVANILSLANGGTGIGTTPTNGQILIGNGSGYTLGTITSGTGIGITNGAGSITIANNGVLSLTGTANQVNVSGTTGAITLSLPQDIATTSTPIFSALSLTSNTNELTLGTGNTGILTLGTLTGSRTYTLPDISGTVCLTSGNCSGVGGSISGSGTTNFITKFTSSSGVGDSSIFDNGKIGIGTTSPEGLFSVSGTSPGFALTELNQTGTENILVGSASGTTRFVFDASGNLNLIGGAYQSGGVSGITQGTPSCVTTNGGIVTGFGTCQLGSEQWQVSNGAIYTGIPTLDFLLGGSATASAKFGVLNISGGTPTASISANNGNNATYLTGAGNLGTTNSQTLTLGGISTGNIVLSPLNGAGIVQINGNLNLASGQNYQIGGTTVLSSTTLGSGVINSSLTSVGNLSSGSLTTGFGNIAIGSSTISGGDITSSGTTGFTASGNGAGLTFSGTGNHIINASSGTLELGATTLTGAITGNGQNITGLNNLSVAGTVTFSAFSSNGGPLYTNGSGVVSQVTAGTTHQVLHGGTTPSFGAVDLTLDVTGTLPVTSGGTGITSVTTGDLLYGSASNTLAALPIGAAGQVLGVSGGVPAWISTTSINFWQRASGTLAPLNITDDLLLGSTATSSAKFAFENVAGGTPTASISANTPNNYTYITGDGTLATTDKQSLTIGSSSTGNIILSGFATGILHSNAAGVLSSSAVNLASADVSGILGVANGGAGVNGSTAANGQLLIGNGSGYSLATITGTTNQVNVANGSGSITLSLPQNINTGASPTFAGLTLSNFSSNGGPLYTNASGVLAQTTAGTTHQVLHGGTTPSFGAVDLTQEVTGTLPIGNGGTNTASIGSAGTVAYSNGTAYAFTSVGTAGQILQSNGSGAPIWVNASGTINFWQENAGALAPLNITDDLLLGATATSSAKFAFENVAGGTPTASISANVANIYTYISGDGTLATTNKQSLTIGSASTGNIILSGFGTGLIHSNASGVLSSSAVALGSADVSGTLGSGNGGTGIGTTPTNGQLLIGNGSGYSLATITGTTNQVNVANGAGSITLSLPQNINSGASPTFAGLTLSNFTSNGGPLYTNGSGVLAQVTAGTSHQVLHGGTTPSFSAVDLSLDVTGTLPIANGGTNAVSIGSAGSLAYSNGSAYAFTAVGSSGQVLESNGSSTPSWVDASTLGTNFWQLNSGALAPLNLTNDLLLGSQATSSAKFAFENVAGGTPTASISANVANSYTYITGDGSLATTNKQSLTIGSSSTGNIILSGFGAGIIHSNAAGVLSSSAVNLASADVTGILGVANGGTGVNGSTAANGQLLIGNGSGYSLATITGTTNQVNVSNGAGSITLSLPQDIATTSTPTFGNLIDSGLANNSAIYTNGSHQLTTTAPTTGVIGYFQRNSGALAPANLTDDLLLGSTATGSAKFAFENVAGGTPTASISANIANSYLYLTGDGSLATTNKQSLTIGSVSTGNIILSGFGTGLIHSNASGVLSSSAVALGSADVTGTLGISNGGTNTNSIGSAGSIAYSNGSSYTFSAVGTSGQALVSGGTGAPTWFAPTQGSLIFAGASGALSQSNSQLFFDSTNNLLGVGTATPISKLDVEGAVTGKALSIFNYTGTDQNILVASKSGTTEFAINNSGSFQFTGGSSFLQTLTSSATHADTYNFPDTGGTTVDICLTSGNCAGAGGGITGTGTTNRLAKFTSTGAIGNGSINDLFTGGVGLTIDASGNLGIGTTTPTAPLHVNGAYGSNAAAIINQLNAGDIFAASASGTTKFLVNNNGNLQFTGNTGFLSTLTTAATAARTYTFPDATGTVCLTTGNCAGSGGGITGSGTSGQIAFFNGSGSITSETTGFAWNTTTKKLGIGNDTPVGKLDVSGAVTGKALAIFNETGDQALFTASASGTSEFTIGHDGTLTSGKYTTNGGLLYTDGSGNVIQLSSVGTNHQVLHGGTSPAYGLVDLTQDVTGILPTANGGSPFDQANGSIFERIATQDLLLGSNATASARFAVTGINAGNTPTATLSAGTTGGTSLTADGKLQTTAEQTLTLGGTTTGDITLAPLNGVAGSYVAPNTDNLVNLGTSSLRFNTIYAGTNVIVNGQSVCLANGTNCPAGAGNFWDQINGVLTPKIETQDLLLGSQATSSAKFAFENVAGGTPTASISANTPNNYTYITGDGTLATTNKQSLTIGSTSTGNIILSGFGTGLIHSNAAGVLSSSAVNLASADVTGVLGIANGGTGVGTTPTNGQLLIGNGSGYSLATITGTTNQVNVSNGSGSITLSLPQNINSGASPTFAGLTLSNFTSNGGPLYTNGSGVLSQVTAGTSHQVLHGGTTPSFSAVDLTLDVSGTLPVTSGGTGISNITTGDLLYGSASNTLAALPIGTSGQVLTVSGGGVPQWTSTSSINFWQRANGAIAPLNITDDLLLGSTATSSAKFAFENVAGGTPTASISAIVTPNALSLDANGGLFTTGKQSLTLGATSTGNISIGTDATARTLSLGNTTGASAVNITAGSGGINLIGTINVGSLNASAFVVTDGSKNLTTTAGSATSAELASILSDETGSGVAVFGTSPTITTSLVAGSASFDLLNTTANTINFGAAASTLNIGASGGTINVGNGGASTLTTTTNGNLTLTAAGSGNVTLSSDFNSSIFVGNATTPAPLSISGGIGNNGAFIVNQTNSGDIIDASQSGALKFAVTNNGSLEFNGGSGFLQTLTSNAAAGKTYNFPTFSGSSADICLNTGNCSGSGTGVTQSGSNSSGQIAFFTSSNNITSDTGLFYDNANKLLGVGNALPVGKLDVKGAVTGKALTILNETGDQAIFTASASGTTEFTINHNGSITANGAISGLTGITSSGTIQLTGLGASAFVVTDGSKNLTTTNGSATSSELANILSDETGSGVAVFGTSPTFTTSIDGSAGTFTAFATPTTINFGQAASTLNIGASGGTINLGNGGASTLTTTTNGNLTVTAAGIGNLTLSSDFNSSVFVGNATTQAPLSISGGIGNNAALVVNNNNSGDLFTASASGTTKFEIGNDGTITAAKYGTGIAHLNSSGVLSSSAINLASADVTGTLGVANGGTGINASSVTSGQLLIGNNSGGFNLNTLTAGTGISISNASGAITISQTGTGASKWTQDATNGVLYPNISTLDVLFGGTATTSAKFAFTGDAGGTPTASISAVSTPNSISLDANGNIGTTGRQTLTLGSGSTGNILISSGTGVTQLADNTIKFTGSGPTISSTNTLTINAFTLGGNISAAAKNISNVGTLDFGGSNISITGNTITSGSTLTLSGATTLSDAGLGTITSAATLGISATTLNIGNGSNAALVTTSNANLTLTAAGSGQTLLSSDFDSGIAIGSANTTAAPLAINGGIGNNAALIVNNTNNGNLFTASSSGTTKFTIDTNGDVTTGIWQGTPVGVQYGGTGINASSVTSGQLLIGNNAGGFSLNTLTAGTGIAISNASGGITISQTGAGSSKFTEDDSNGVLYPNISTLDLLLGGTSTASAKFAFMNNAGNTPTASISANNGNNATYLTGGGTLGTTNGQTLTLGSASTGNIAFSPAGTGILTVSPNGLSIPYLGSGSSNVLSIGVSGGGTGFNISNAGGSLTVQLGSTSCINPGSSTAKLCNAQSFSNPSGSTIVTQNLTTKVVGTVTTGETGYNNLSNIVDTSTGGANTLYGFYIDATGTTNSSSSVNSLTAKVNSGQTGNFLQFLSGSTTAMQMTNTGSLSLGTATPLATLDVRGNSGTIPAASISGNTSFATTVIDQSGSGDLFTASKSGATKFTILNNGDIQINNLATGIAHVSSTGVLSSSAVNLAGTDVTGTLGVTHGGTGLSSFTTGDLVYASATNTLAALPIGTSGQVLTVSGGGVPQWTSTSSINFWQRASGAIAPLNITDDFLLGATATSSAKFAFLNNAGGTPTASIAGNLALAVPLGANPSSTFNLYNGGTFGIKGSVGGDAGLSTNPLFLLSNTGAATFQNSSNSTTAFQVLNGVGTAIFDVDTSNGRVGIGTNSPGAKLNVTAVSGAGVAAARLNQSGTSDILQLQSSGTTVVDVNNVGLTGIGTTSQLATLDVRNLSGTLSVASVSGNTSFATTVVDQSGSGDIFTASKSGATKFTILNNGNVQINNLGTGVVQSGATGILSSSALNLAGGSSLITGVLPVGNGGTGQSSYTDGQLLIGNSTGNTLTKATLTAGTGISITNGSGSITISQTGSGSSKWTQDNANGVLYPNISTLDVLFGGTATTSAKFAFLNNAGNTPTASISANSSNNNTYVTGDGTVGTTNRQTLSLGSASSGNVVINAGSGVTQLANNTISLTGTAPTISSTNTLTINAFTLGGNISAATKNITNVGTLDLGSGNLSLNGNTITSGSTLTLSGATTLSDSGLATITSAATLGISATTLNLGGGSAAVLGTTSNSNLTLTPNGSGQLLLSSDFDSGVAIGSANTTAAPLVINGGIGNNAALIVNQKNNGDLLDASASGTLKFQITNGGSVNVVGGQTSDIDTLTGTTLKIGASTATGITLGNASAVTTAAGGLTVSSGKNLTLAGITGNNQVLFATASTGVVAGVTGTSTASQCLLSGATTPSWGSCDLGTTSWVQQNGTIYPGNSTEDLLVGGTATASAKFAFENVAGGTPTASISAIATPNALSLDAGGNIFTTGKQSLTLGAASTGNIAIGTDATARTLSLGNSTGASAVNITAGSGNINLSGTINASSLGASAFVVTDGSKNLTTAVGAATSSELASILSDETGSGAVVFGTSPTFTTSATDPLLIGGTAAGSSLTLESTSGTGSNDFITFKTGSQSERMRIDTSGNVGIGSNFGSVAALATLDVRGNSGTTPVATISGQTAKAALFVDNAGVGDLFAASKSGATKFVIGNDGTFQTNGATATVGYNRIGSGTTTGGFLTNPNDLLITGKFEVAGSLQVDNGLVVNGTQGTVGWIQRVNNAISPSNITDDLLLGGTATTSAKFAFINNAGGTPTASISAVSTPNGISLDANGNIGTTANQTLSLGTSTTGNIFIGTRTISANDQQDVCFFSNSTCSAAQSTGSNINNKLKIFGGNGQTRVMSIYQVANGDAHIDSSFGNLQLTTTSNNAGIFLLPNGTGQVGIGSQGTGTFTTLATLDVRGNIGTTPVASLSGTTAKASLVVDNDGVGDILTASQSGNTLFTVKNSGTVVIGNSTNGITFDPTGNTTAIYSGSARPTKQIVLSPEFAGAVLTASGSASTNGFMTSDASPSASSSTYNFENYYQWTSTQTSLQDYTVAVRVTLPKDFSGWATSGNAMSIDLNTNLKDTASDKLDVLIYNQTFSASTPVLFDQAQASSTNNNWTTRGYTSSQLSNWATAGQTAVIYLKMYAKNGLFVQVGDIKLNYLSAF